MLILYYAFFSLLTFLMFVFLVRRNSLDFFITSFFLNLYHFFFSLAFYFFAKDKPNDSMNYYNWSINSLDDFKFSSGTGFLVHFVNFLRVLLVDYQLIFLFFSMISSLVILFFFKIIFDFKQKGYLSNKGFKFLTFLLFIPGLHFWTVSIGKDCLILLFITIFLYAYYKKLFKLLIFSLLFLAFIRIHVFAILFIAFMLNEFFYGNYKFKNISMSVYRFIIILLAIPTVFLIYNVLFNIVQKYSADGFSDFGDFIENRSEVYSSEGSGLLLSSQPYIFKVLAFLLGGLPWLSLDVLSIFSMLEGLIIISVMAYLFFNLLIKKHEKNSKQIFVLLFIVIFSLFMPIISANLGIMVRMRIMLYMPIYFVLLVFLIDSRKKVKMAP